jgi:hypothetical protein
MRITDLEIVENRSTRSGVAQSGRGCRCRAAIRQSMCRSTAVAMALSVLTIPISMFRSWAALVRLADPIKALAPSTTTHLA